MTPKKLTSEITRLLNQCNVRQLSIILRMVRVILK